MQHADQLRCPRCPYCAAPLRVVWVHGHGQCATCRINIDECCRGETCTPSGSEHDSSS